MKATTARPTVTVRAEDLNRLAYDLASAAGASPANAEAISAAYLHADLSGYGLQGIDYIPYLLDHLLDGRINGKAIPKVLRTTAATALVDGGLGPGQRAATFAADLAAKKARSVGTSAVGVTNSGDIFMLGYYAGLIADAGMIGMVFTAGPPLVHPLGGVERMLGTNPLATAFPTGETPLVFDMATSAVARSRIREAYYHGEEVPPGLALNARGEATTNAEEIYKGGVLGPLAGHKGFGLALSVALLCGPLTGSAIGPDLSWMDDGGESVGMGHFFIAVDPNAFGPADAFGRRASTYLDSIKASKKAPGVDEIRLPGERAKAEREGRRRDGVPVLKAGWERIAKYAERLGVAMPNPVA